VKNSVSEKRGDDIGGDIRGPEPSEALRKFPVLEEITQVENDLFYVTTRGLHRHPNKVLTSGMNPLDGLWVSIDASAESFSFQCETKLTLLEDQARNG
jgi:hypothetical protein